MVEHVKPTPSSDRVCQHIWTGITAAPKGTDTGLGLGSGLGSGSDSDSSSGSGSGTTTTETSLNATANHHSDHHDHDRATTPRLTDGEDDQEGDSHYIQEAEGKNEYKFYSYFHEHSDLFYGYHYMDYGGYRLRGFHGHQTEGTHPDLHQHHHNKPDNDNYMYGYYGYYYAYQDFN
eukprot:g1120.t1